MTVASVVAEKKAVIFDLFHTLTSVESSSSDRLPSTSQVLGVDRAAWNYQLLEHSRDRLVGLETDPFRIIAKLARAIDASVSDERIKVATENRMARFRAALLEVPDETIAVLEQLKARGKLLGLITNADVMEITAWEESRIHHLFDSTILSCRVGLAKPERQIYELALAQLGVEAAETVFVGDGGSDELRGARRAGITAVMIAGVIRKLRPGEIPGRASQADYVIESLDELLAG